MCPLFNGFLPEAAKLFEIHQVKVIKNDKPVEILHHKSFDNNVSVDLIHLRFTYIVFTHGRRLDGVKYTHLKETGNKVSYNVDSRPMMLLSDSRESSLDTNIWKPSASFEK